MTILHDSPNLNLPSDWLWMFRCNCRNFYERPMQKSGSFRAFSSLHGCQTFINTSRFRDLLGCWPAGFQSTTVCLFFLKGFPRFQRGSQLMLTEFITEVTSEDEGWNIPGEKIQASCTPAKPNGRLRAMSWESILILRTGCVKGLHPSPPTGVPERTGEKWQLFALNYFDL